MHFTLTSIIALAAKILPVLLLTQSALQLACLPCSPATVLPQSGVPAITQLSTAPNLICLQKCNILVMGTDGTVYGYISPVWNSFGEYRAFQQDIDFTATNSPNTAFPFLGATTGFASSHNNFAPGSFKRD
ncbi:hypothetical protein B0H10DRAFT_2224358 [Mycena sp. CBHHK59/15]|nr:hypothetical protein B0H10DRAFT_2224358 [Mycena sp. CBHHK59/15]